MRAAFVDAMLAHAKRRDLFFLTGDLGFMALEPLRDALGKRFINCGVAEQNMIGVAAGLAQAGHEVWVYSIAPFCYARPFEQIRNDLCFHSLPVRLVGNGGGYAYGVMGPTHHALEDYGALLTLPGMTIVVPAGADDIPGAVATASAQRGPAYLRLGRDEFPEGVSLPSYRPWRRLRAGSGAVVIVCGPLASTVYSVVTQQEKLDAELWVLSEMPLSEETFPEPLKARLANGSPLLVIEEHREHGGVGMSLAHLLMKTGLAPGRFRTLCARGYPSGRYGSQAFHRRESGLDAVSFLAALQELGP